LYSLWFADVSRGKKSQFLLAAVRKTNEFDDADFWKNCGNVEAFFRTPCRHTDTF